MEKAGEPFDPLIRAACHFPPSTERLKKMTACELKAFHNRTVSITFEDGEVATAHLSCRSEDCDEVMVDVFGTSHPDRYPQIHTCTYVVYAAEIASVVEIVPLSAEPSRYSLQLVEEPAVEQERPDQPLAA